MFKKALRIITYITVFLVPVFFLPFSFEVLEFNKLYLFFFLTGLAVLAWLGRMIFQDKELKISHSLVDYAILAFILTAALSFIFSVDKIKTVFF